MTSELPHLAGYYVVSGARYAFLASTPVASLAVLGIALYRNDMTAADWKIVRLDGTSDDFPWEGVDQTAEVLAHGDELYAPC